MIPARRLGPGEEFRLHGMLSDMTRASFCHSLLKVRLWCVDEIVAEKEREKHIESGHDESCRSCRWVTTGQRGAHLQMMTDLRFVIMSL
jgi:hypothetical protein